MARYQQPPYNFECEYQHNCPHLEGLSTQWVWSEYLDSSIRDQEKWQIIDELDAQLEQAKKHIRELERKNSELKAKLHALHQKQFKKNRKIKADKSNASSEISPKKKRGAPFGHPGWSRAKPKYWDQTIEVAAPNECPHCRCDQLTPVDDLKEHFQEDIILKPRTVVTRFLHQQAYCKKCNRTVIQAGPNELLNAPIGPVAKSVAIYLRYCMGLPYRKVQRLFYELFSFKFVPASAVGFDQQATAKAKEIYEDLREKIKASTVIYADETGWRQDGINHYVWFAGNSYLAFFHIDRHRSSQVAQSVLGSNFNGTLVSDAYAAYNATNPKARQSCLAHVIRHTKEIAQEISLQQENSCDQNAREFCSKVENLFSRACAAGQKLLTHTPEKHQALITEKRFTEELEKICAGNLEFKPAETLRTRLIGKEKDYLFTFLRKPDVQPTNNLAERSLRPIVILRKIIFGTRSQKGSLSHSVIPSLLLTAQRQGQHPRDFLQILLTSDTATAQAALYNDSS